MCEYRCPKNTPRIKLCSLTYQALTSAGGQTVYIQNMLQPPQKALTLRSTSRVI